MTPGLYRKKVFGIMQRILHWWIGFTILVLIALGVTQKLIDTGTFKQSLTTLHIWCGFFLALGFFFRLLLGLFGPDQATFRNLIRTSLRFFKPKDHSNEEAFGYDSHASVAYIGFYMMVFVGVLSGLILAGMRYDLGPFAPILFDELQWHEITLWAHESVLYLFSLFIAAHLIGMTRHEKKTGLPVAQAMISGYQYRQTKDERGEK